MMNKRQSLDILDQCINWVKDASDKDVENMRKIYQEETQNALSIEDNSLCLMTEDIPFVVFDDDNSSIVQGREQSVLEETIKRYLGKPCIQDEQTIYNNGDVFHEVAMDCWKDVAA